MISDLGHIVKASGCGARVDVDALPKSDAMMRHVDDGQALRWALSGGEDYELCFTVPELNRGALDVAIGQLGVHFTCIGQMSADIEGLNLYVTECLSPLTGKDMTILPRHKDVAKSRLNLRQSVAPARYRLWQRLSPVVPGTMARWRRSPSGI
ncbi:thiamine-monophosphate kinase [Salmonella enterica subsp. enterica]|uniref:Thiamine-monophosphate kinase n=1 Tax=Salmonella enterica I TaxID=59201 RepID=A0A379WYJ1_SALET|nr:thiamine-monophosphate kinase [Salmonella enterica subsp. enterica]